MRTSGAGDPFAVLGLDAAAGLADDDVRAAWRRIAAATHPDRTDGGDPEVFAAAAAAYTDLRTSFGRGEARARLAGGGTARASGRAAGLRARPAPGGAARRVPRGAARRVPRGAARLASRRAARLACRAVAAAAAVAVALLAAGPGPAGPALAAGALTWLAVTARRDLAATRWPGGNQPGSGPVATGRDGSAHHADHEPT